MAALIGNGLYGVDVKQNDEGVYVIEINDNPNIDAGVEDGILGAELYQAIIDEFLRRLNLRKGVEEAAKSDNAEASANDNDRHAQNAF